MQIEFQRWNDFEMELFRKVTFQKFESKEQ